MMIKNSDEPGYGKEYMISLRKWRSRMALLACVITLFATMDVIGKGLVDFSKNGTDIAELFHYFTINSNILTALAAGIIIPFAIEGIRKKRFTYPKWAAIFHYSGTICTTLTMIFAICVISWFDPNMAFGGTNLFLHLICPILVLISFFMVESDHHYTFRDSLIGLIPFFIYCSVYLYQVIFVGENNGGWSDFYHVTDYVPLYISFLGIMLMGFGIALAIRLFSNRLNECRRKKLTAFWKPDADPVEIKIEVFGLGRYTGKYGDKDNICLPLDILELMAKRYSIKTDELLRVFIKGMMEGMKEKSK